jgi:predicted Na+-dependent transporter
MSRNRAKLAIAKGMTAMTISELLTLIAQVSGLLFIVTSMLAMGMSLTMSQILEPLKNARLVILVLLANFVLVPLWAYVLTLVLPLGQPLQIGLMVLATAAGAPFLPKLVQGAKGNVAFGVGMMVLLMVVTILYMPIVLPLLLPGVSVNPWDIAKSLIILMLVPLALGMLFKSHSPDSAEHWQPVMNKTSTVSVLVLLVVGLGLNISNIINLIGSFGLLAILLLVGGSLLIGFLLGGGDPAIRSVMGLGTAQRNISAAILVTAQNFAGTETLPFVLVAGVLLLLVLLPAAKWMGARIQGPSTGEQATVKQQNN